MSVCFDTTSLIYYHWTVCRNLFGTVDFCADVCTITYWECAYDGGYCQYCKITHNRFLSLINCVILCFAFFFGPLAIVFLRRTSRWRQCFFTLRSVRKNLQVPKQLLRGLPLMKSLSSFFPFSALMLNLICYPGSPFGSNPFTLIFFFLTMQSYEVFGLRQ